MTDADLVLGSWTPTISPAVRFTLCSPDNSKRRRWTDHGRPLDMDTTTAAFGLAEVVDENMANAARVHAVENGEDLSDYTMIAFGGAAPSARRPAVRESLGIERLLVPPGAGVGSAIGFLRAPFQFRGQPFRLHEVQSAFDARHNPSSLLADLRDEATGFVRTL